MWVLFIGSGLFFALSFHKFQEQRIRDLYLSQFEEKKREIFSFKFDEILADLTPFMIGDKIQVVESQKHPEFVALLLINTEICPSCILEIHELIDVFESFTHADIHPVIVVLEKHENLVQKFLSKSMFKADSFYGRHPKLEKIIRIMDNRPPVEQLIAFVNVPHSRVFYRSIIPSRLTSLPSKQRLLEEIFTNA